MGITLMGSALLVLALAAPVRAEPDGGTPGDKPDTGAPLVVVPNASAAPAPKSSERPGLPPPPALDSKRTPMPDRLANDHWLQYFPQAPPTPPVPENTGKTGTASGGGAKKVNTIFGPAVGTRPPGGAPADVPRGSVTRTPEDQMAPPAPAPSP